MKTKDKKALHSKTIVELTTQLAEKRGQLVATRMELRMNKLKNVHTTTAIRSDIAILETIKRAKEITNV